MLRKLVLIRHGELPDEYSRVFVGRLDSPLGESGRRACARLTPVYPRFGAEKLYASPLRRTRESAEIIAPDVKPVFDDRLMEMNFGLCEGLTFQQIQERFPALASAWMNSDSMRKIAFPGGESVRNVMERVHSFLEELRRAPEETVAVVTHGGVLVYLLRECVRIDTANEWDFLPGRGSLSMVKFHSPGEPGILKLYNFIPSELGL